MVFFCEMVILVVFNSFNVVKILKKPDPVARQMPPFYTTNVQKCLFYICYNGYGIKSESYLFKRPSHKNGQAISF